MWSSQRAIVSDDHLSPKIMIASSVAVVQIGCSRRKLEMDMMAAEALALKWLAEIEFIRVRQSQIQPPTTLLKKDNNWTQKEFYMQHYVVPWMTYQPFSLSQHSMHVSKPIATQELPLTLLIGPSVILTPCTFLQLAIHNCLSHWALYTVAIDKKILTKYHTAKYS